MSIKERKLSWFYHVKRGHILKSVVKEGIVPSNKGTVEKGVFVQDITNTLNTTLTECRHPGQTT